jgi:replicative DNA helicase
MADLDSPATSEPSGLANGLRRAAMGGASNGRRNGNGFEPRMPANVEAEQALLGAILVDNEAFFRVSHIVEEEHFFDPLHRRIFGVVSTLVQSGRLASPVTVKSYLESDPALAEVGGGVYLAHLAGNAPTIINAPDYARTIFEHAQRRGLIHVGQELVVQASDADVELSPGEQIELAEHRLYELAERAKYEGGFQSFGKASTDAIDSITRAYERPGHLSGLPTGLVDLDRILGGLHKSDLVVLAGRPSIGKTSLATNIAFNVACAYREETRPDGTRRAAQGGIVAFFSLEMSGEQLAMRLLAEHSGIPSPRLRKGDLKKGTSEEDDEFRRVVRAAKELHDLPLHIDDTGGLSIAALAARARRLRRQKGLELIVVDYLQLVASSASRRNDGRVQEVTEITQGLKALAKELNVPVLALSQLSRKVEDREDKRPQLADLRESGSIEQDADVVMFVYREEYYVERTKPSESELEKMIKWQQKMEEVHGLAEVIIGKQRNGPTGTVELQFQAELTRFANKARRDGPHAG